MEDSGRFINMKAMFSAPCSRSGSFRCLGQFVFLVVCALAPGLSAVDDIPRQVAYQGWVRVAGVNFNGSGQFKFAITDAAGTTSHWSHDGTSVAGAEPSGTPVTATVTDGLFAIRLGDTGIANMAALTDAVFANQALRLKVWFSSDNGASFAALGSPSPLIAAPFAMRAQDARSLDGTAPTATGLAVLGAADAAAARTAIGAAASGAGTPGGANGNVQYNDGAGGFAGSANLGYDATLASGGLSLANTTSSTSPTTGALKVAGGVGIGGRMFLGGDRVELQSTDPVLYFNNTDGGANAKLWLIGTGSSSLAFSTRNDADTLGSEAIWLQVNKIPPGAGVSSIAFPTNAPVLLQAGIGSTSSTTGSAVITGGLGVSENITAAGTTHSFGATRHTTGVVNIDHSGTALYIRRNNALGGSVQITASSAKPTLWFGAADGTTWRARLGITNQSLTGGENLVLGPGTGDVTATDRGLILAGASGAATLRSSSNAYPVLAVTADESGTPTGDTAFVRIEGAASPETGNSRGLLVDTQARRASTMTTLGSYGLRSGSAWTTVGAGTADSSFVIRTRVDDTLGDRFLVNEDGSISVTGADTSSSATSGSLRTAGGAGIAKNLWLGQEISFDGMAAPATSGAGKGRIYFDSAANKFKVSEHDGAYVDLVGSGGLGGSAAATQVAYGSGANTLTSDASLTYDATASTGGLSIGNGTPSTTTTSGSLKVTGGIGATGAINTGSEVAVRSGSGGNGFRLYDTNLLKWSLHSPGNDFAITGASPGVVLQLNENGTSFLGAGGLMGGTRTTTINGQVGMPNSTASSSTTSGALVVTGGVGVGGKLYTGGTALINAGQVAAGPSAYFGSETANTQRVEIHGVGAAGGGGIRIIQNESQSRISELFTKDNTFNIGVNSNWTAANAQLSISGVTNIVSAQRLAVSPGNVGGATASTERSDVTITPGSTQFATGALATQRSVVFNAPTYAFVGASTITNASTLAIAGPPTAGTNATITNAYALNVESGTARFGGAAQVTNSTATTDKITGALVVTGGIASGGTIFGNQISLSHTTGSSRLTLSSNPDRSFVQGIGGQILTLSGDHGGSPKVEIASGSDLLVADTTASTSTTTGAFRVAGGVGIAGSITIGKHLQSRAASQPTVAAGAGAGTSPTIGLSNHTDMAGRISVATGSTSGTGTLATITFASAYTTAPIVILTATNSNGANLNVFVGATTTTTFTLDAGSAPADSTTYTWNYQVIETQ
jgi:hypothetical protein